MSDPPARKLHLWPLLMLATTMLVVSGCTATPEVKQASSEVGAALKQLHGARRDYQNAYISELDEIQNLIVTSILSDAVNNRVAEMVSEGFEGDLIQLSSSIKYERDLARKRVDLLLGKLPEDGSGPDYQKFVTDTLSSAAPSLRRTADLVESPDPEQAKILRDAADRIEQSLDAKHEVEALVQLVTLEATKADIVRGLSDLGNYLKFLEMIHKWTNEWVTTDLKVDGEKLADFFDTLATTISAEERL